MKKKREDTSRIIEEKTKTNIWYKNKKRAHADHLHTH